jgi:hypothetical protein
MVAGCSEEGVATIDVSYWERRSSADREVLGKSALALTQAMRAAGATSSRLYWAAPDTGR